MRRNRFVFDIDSALMGLLYVVFTIFVITAALFLIDMINGGI